MVSYLWGDTNVMDLPQRKINRLKDYNYNQNGAYFITICTKDRRPILSEIVGDDAGLRRRLPSANDVGFAKRCVLWHNDVALMRKRCYAAHKLRKKVRSAGRTDFI
ncbi:MAG: hypothetical protein IKK30_00375 [Clostridia bacterium]|nr:hypothetical protein [Clostridia bacterium]